MKNTSVGTSVLPRVIRSPQELSHWRKTATGAIGVVPTMGALHQGHATLLRKIRSRCDISVLTLFVNPIQFGPNEDLSRYPKTFERDLEIAAAEGVDVVFAPEASTIYSPEHSTFVEEQSISRFLCGKFRPGHFRGVTTVVLKLFHLIQPSLALFGLKDAQQFFILDRMVKDLNLGTRIEGVSTVRELDGLALSSRNVYLSSDNRSKAPFLYECLLSAQTHIQNGFGIATTLQNTHQRLLGHGFDVQYLECHELPVFRAIQLD